MQFSIRRPKLPSSETHPEENTYKRLDVSAWLHHLNEAGQVEEEYKLQKVRGVAAARFIPSLLPRSASPQAEAARVCFHAGGKNWAFGSVKTGVWVSAGALAGTADESVAGRVVEHLPARGGRAVRLLMLVGISKLQCPVLDVFAKCSVSKSKKEKLRLLYGIMQGLRGSTGSRS